MKYNKIFFRLLYINYILAKNGLDQVIVSLKLFAPFRFLIYLNPWNWFRKNKLNRADAIRKTLEELGPIFVKFGQALSTRPDIIPQDIALELCKLQDKVPSFPGSQALAILESTFNQSAYDLFAQFSIEPLACASIAQVHAATLKTGEEVIVKILRPDVKNLIIKDLKILNILANLADKYWAESKRLKPKELVSEFERHLLDELDLQREAANASQLRRNFQDSPLLYVPKVYWDYVRENILVTERIYGIPITDVATLNEYKINIKKLAERGIEIFFTQVLRDCFFHADMHPGNIFVSYNHPDNPQYICVDFGIIGTLTDQDKRYIAENLLAFFNRDYKKVAELHVQSGWVPNNTCVNDLESAVRTVCEPIFQKPLKEISFGVVIIQLLKVVRRFNMEVQPQLVLLQKTLLAVEGLGRQLYPDLDLWENAKPFLEKWVKEQLGPKALYKNLKANLPFFVEELPFLPKLLHEVLALNKEKIKTEILTQELDKSDENIKVGFQEGLGIGLVSSLTGVAALSYFNMISVGQLGIVAITLGLTSGVIALVKR